MDGPLRVELEDGRSTARVTISDAEREIPIVAARADEDARAALARAPGDAVLLQEGAATAMVRVGDAVTEGVDIIRAGERVRVAAVRERAAEPEASASFLSRLLGRAKKEAE